MSNNMIAQIFHFDLYGKREEKFDFLNKQSISSIEWKELAPQAPNYFFVHKNFDELSEYEKGFSVSELFPKNSVGIVTARDAILINDSKTELIKTVNDHYSIEPNEILIHKVAYRPFDCKYLYYDIKLVERAREKVMQHFINGKNVGLVYKLGNAEVNSVSVMVTNKITEFRSWSRSGMQGGDYVAPLYLYAPDGSRTPNLNPEIVDRIAEEFGLSFTNEKKQNANSQELTANSFSPIDLLDYIYAVLHSPSYRERYKEFLKIDFPRVPYPKNADTFWQLVKLGGEIRQIHLLESPVVENYITQYPIDGDNVVIKPEYKDGKVYINETQYFDKVPQVAWDFYIGGYQPAQKWLKDRKDRHLDFEDILHYQKIIVALVETDRIMKAIDI